MRQLEDKQQFVKEKNQEITDLLEKQNRNGETKRGGAEGATGGGGAQTTRARGKKNREYDAVQKAIEEVDVQESEAATVIQKRWKGRQARKEVEQKKKEHDDDGARAGVPSGAREVTREESFAKQRSPPKEEELYSV